jgi:diguanylate cyclase (GGDEF)-like protein
MTTSLLPFLLGLLVTAGLLVPLVLRWRGRAEEAGERAADLETQVGELRRSQAQGEEDQRALTQFLKEFPHVARDLFSGLAERQLPATLLHVVQRSLDPAQVVVLVRRGQEGGDARLVVAAAFPENGTPRLGTEIPVDRGELGYVAESQLVATRKDLAADEVKERIKPGGDPLPGVHAELMAPLVFDQDTLGLIVLSRPRRTIGDGKAALRLISQTGAQALHAAAAYSRVRITAEVDGLTRVFNKRHMEQSLSELIYRTACAAYDRRGASSAGPSESLSIFLFDLDNFKHYNDTNGHLPGDKLLQELARLVQESIRRDDIFGRFGGEEFLVVMPGTDLVHALGAANKLRGAIAARKFPFAEKQPMGVISVSGGVAEYPNDGMDAATLLSAADAALYEAKRGGRNRVMAASRAKAEAPPDFPRPATPGRDQEKHA